MPEGLIYFYGGRIGQALTIYREDVLKQLNMIMV